MRVLLLSAFMVLHGCSLHLGGTWLRDLGLTKVVDAEHAEET